MIQNHWAMYFKFGEKWYILSQSSTATLFNCDNILSVGIQ